MSDDLATCDHCQRPRRELRTHLLPLTLHADAWDGSAMTPRAPLHAACVLLCRHCGDQRQEDIRAFLAGQAPTDLVWAGEVRL